MTAASAVFFDLDGTLVRDGAADAVHHTADELAARHGLLAADILAANAAAWRECWSSLGEPWMRGGLSGDALPREIWRLTLERYGQSDPSLVDEAVTLHVDAERLTFAPFPETVEVLDTLKDLGLALGLITNGPSEFQRGKLSAAGIDGYFDLVVASGDIGLLKPAPEVFRRALAGLDVEPDRAIHVGDDFGADVAGAAGAGMAAVWINREAARPPRDDVPHHDGRSLRAVLQLVGRGSGITPR